jgi:hypothetical protein
MVGFEGYLISSWIIHEYLRWSSSFTGIILYKDNNSDSLTRIFVNSQYVFTSNNYEADLNFLSLQCLFCGCYLVPWSILNTTSYVLLASEGIMYLSMHEWANNYSLHVYARANWECLPLAVGALTFQPPNHYTKCQSPPVGHYRPWWVVACALTILYLA